MHLPHVREANGALPRCQYYLFSSRIVRLEYPSVIHYHLLSSRSDLLAITDVGVQAATAVAIINATTKISAVVRTQEESGQGSVARTKRQTPNILPAKKRHS